NGQNEIILCTRSGMAIRFAEDSIRVMGRNAAGVRGIALANDDIVVGMAVVASGGEAVSSSDPLAASSLLTVCENGYGKRTAIDDYRQQGRGGKGVIDIKTDDRNGPVIGISAVSDENGVMMITSAGKIIRIPVSGVSVIGRNTRGVRLINLDEGETVVAVAHIADAEGENGEDIEEGDA
ncbi:MAG: DNA gyrase subunit A, partial [Bdellovibrionales bacterium]|nr:DNA gyrase subunit A [Bdellovibrionales bacterium]